MRRKSVWAVTGQVGRECGVVKWETGRTNERERERRERERKQYERGNVCRRCDDIDGGEQMKGT